MGISNSEFDDFTKQLISVMNASGVTLADQATVQTILETTRTLIVVPQGAQPPPTTTGSTPVTTGGPSSTTGTPTTGTPTTGTPTTGTPTTGTPTTGTPTTGTPSTPTFCNKYATAKQLTQQQLVAAVIDGVVQILVAPGSVNLKYFNGTQPAGSLNFLLPTSAAALSNLKLHLVAFFGQMGVLGCDDPTFPRYTGQTLQQIHAPMGITQSDNDAFTAAVLATLMSAGVTSQTDLNAVSSLLTSVSPQIVSSGSSSSTTPSPVSGLTTWQIGVIAAVGVAVIIAVVVVIICCIKRGKGETSNYVAF